MKNLTKAVVGLLLAGSFLLPAGAVLAYGPNLSLSGSGGNITLSINSAPANSQIQLYYTQSGSNLPIIINNFGVTDYSGNFTTTISNGAYGSNDGSQVYVIVGGQQSNTAYYNGYGNGCTYNCGNPGALSLSQNSVTLNVGQSQVITAYSGGANLNISTYPQSNIATVSISGNQVTVYGASSGTTSFSVCSNYFCASVYVTVNNNGCTYNCGSSLNLITNTLPTMTIGQYYSYQLQASGGTPPYNFSVNSGNLPSGLYLSTSGLIYGTPQFTSSSGFAIRISDSYGRVGYGQVYINGNGSVLGTSTYNNGQLISINGTVYIVYKNSLVAFGNASAFLGLGYNFSQVVTSYNTNIPVSGYVISTSRTAHPWGAWIKNGSTVYLVHELGLIPVPDWNTFLNNGGQGNWIVNANSWDFQLPILSPMASNDTRVH